MLVDGASLLRRLAAAFQNGVPLPLAPAEHAVIRGVPAAARTSVLLKVSFEMLGRHALGELGSLAR